MTQVITRSKRQLAAVFAALMLLAGLGVASTVNAKPAEAVVGSTAYHSNSKPANFPYKVSSYALKVTKTNGTVVWMSRGESVTNVKKVCNTRPYTRKLLVSTGGDYYRTGACHYPSRKGAYRYILIA